MKRDVLTIPLTAVPKQFKYEFSDRRGVTRFIIFNETSVKSAAEFMEDLAKSLKGYMSPK